MRVWNGWGHGIAIRRALKFQTLEPEIWLKSLFRPSTPTNFKKLEKAVAVSWDLLWGSRGKFRENRGKIAENISWIATCFEV